MVDAIVRAPAAVTMGDWHAIGHGRGGERWAPPYPQAATAVAPGLFPYFAGVVGLAPPARAFPAHETGDYAGEADDHAAEEYDHRRPKGLQAIAAAGIPVVPGSDGAVTTEEEAIAAANTTDNRGRELLRLFNATNRAAPFEMASATTTVRSKLFGGRGAD